MVKRDFVIAPIVILITVLMIVNILEPSVLSENIVGSLIFIIGGGFFALNSDRAGVNIKDLFKNLKIPFPEYIEKYIIKFYLVIGIILVLMGLILIVK
jgi:hypothetical protein